MNQCNTAAPAMQKLDPTKRVNYTAGLVLGVEEFQQEQYYFIEKTRWHNRFLHGYGTTSGLQVDLADTGGGGLEVRVSSSASRLLWRGTSKITPHKFDSLAEFLKTMLEIFDNHDFPFLFILARLPHAETMPRATGRD